MAGLTDITKNGTQYEFMPRSTAGQFSTSTAYAVGDYCYFDGTLYRCTTAHAAGAFVASHFTAVTIDGELKAKETEIENVKSDLTQLVRVPFSERDGYVTGNGGILLDGTTSNATKTTSKLYFKPSSVITFSLDLTESKSQWIAYALYAEDGSFISRTIPVNNVTGKTWSLDITMPSNAYYILFSYRTYNIATISITSAYAVAQAEEELQAIPVFERVKLDAEYSKNICNAYDSDNVVNNTYVIYNTGRLTDLSNWCAIQFPVEGGRNISTNVSGAHIAFFSKYNDITHMPTPSVLDGFISGQTGILSGFTVPSTAKYAVISIPMTAKQTVQVEYGNTQTDYAPYIKGLHVDKIVGLEYSETVEYTIKADGTGDFTNLKACFESITDSSEKKRYVVNVYPGEYDIASLYSDYSVSGLTIPNYTTLRGIGDKHNVILTAELQTQSTDFSVLNIKDVCRIENLTLKSKNCRYTVHDDFQTTRDTKCTREIKNVIFKGEYTAYGSVYGSGLKGSANWKFENCEFDASKSASNGTAGNAFSNHNNTNVTTPSFISFRNCRLLNGSQSYKTVRLNSMTNGSANGTVTVTFEGCKIDGIYLGENNASEYGAGINYWVNGFGNENTLGVTISNTDSEDYSGNVDLI